MAIRNAKIVTVSGPVIAKGTVVVRNGLIEAVGENVAVPADAMVVEGEGLTVYPGLIDALEHVGTSGRRASTRGAATAGAADAVPRPAHSGGHYRGLAPSRRPPARGPEDRPQTTSWVKIADEVQSNRPAHRNGARAPVSPPPSPSPRAASSPGRAR